MKKLVMLLLAIPLVGCTTFNPKDDKDVSYTWENVSYQSPNSAPSNKIGAAEGTFNFNKKLF